MKVFFQLFLVIFLLCLSFFIFLIFGYEKLYDKYELIQNDFLKELAEKTRSMFEEVVREQTSTPVTVNLKYGGSMKGLLLKETKTEYIIFWKEQE